MRLLFTAILFASFALPANAAVVHDESVNGDLSSNEALPTPLAFALGPNIVRGTMGNVGGLDRDYLTFTIPAGQKLSGLYLLALAPDNPAFASFNAGNTSFIPSQATNALFLSGIHPDGLDVGDDLMPFFVTEAVTTNHLALPELGPGAYSFLMQQTSALTQQYSLEFLLMDIPVPAEPKTWGAVKNLYR